MSRAEYEACQASDEASLRAAIDAVIVKSLRAGTANVDYKVAVAQEWRRSGIEDILDKATLHLATVLAEFRGADGELIQRQRTAFIERARQEARA